MKEENEAVKNVKEEVREVTEYDKVTADVEASGKKVDAEEETTGLVEKAESYAEETAETIEGAKEDGSSENSDEVKSEEESDASEEHNAEESDTEASDQEIDPHVQNLGKNDAARLLVKKAKIIVDEAEAQLSECKLLLDADLEGYENAKKSLKENGLEASEALLVSLSGYTSEDKTETEAEEIKEASVVFEPKEQIAPIHIKNISSGTFSGLIMALIAGFATFAGLLYVATEKAGITLDVSKMPAAEEFSTIFKALGSLVGMPKEPMIGAGLLVVSTLVVIWLVYKIRVVTKANKNLAMAKEQLAAAEAYSEQKGSCKQEMDKVDAYINEAIKTMKLYQVVLNEQKGKLERILHLEEEKIQDADFHHKSEAEIKDTRELIEAIKDFMSVPMSEEGKLSGKSSLFLHRAKSKIQKVIDRFY